MREIAPVQDAVEFPIAPEDNSAPESMKEAFIHSVCANDKRTLTAIDQHAFSVMFAETINDLRDEMEIKSLEKGLPSFDRTKLTQDQEREYNFNADREKSFERNSTYQVGGFDEMMSSQGEIACAFRDVVSAFYVYDTVNTASGIDDDVRGILSQREFVEFIQKSIKFMVVSGRITRSSDESRVVRTIAGIFNLELNSETVKEIATIVNQKLREHGDAPLVIE